MFGGDVWGAALGDRSKLGAQGGLTKNSGPGSDLRGTPAVNKMDYMRERAAIHKLIRKSKERKNKLAADVDPPRAKRATSYRPPQ